MSDSLPIYSVLPELNKHLASTSVILSAPTGCGKTTVVPLELMNAEWLHGRKIVVLEPRRIAAKNAAHYMSRLLGEEIGNRVGYRIRHEKKISANTRIEVVTEGVLTRQIQNDPELQGIGLVIFDEFHERSLQADLGLALCLDLLALRDDLRLLVMSATLDTGPLAALMENAKVVQAAGKSYPVSVHYLQREDKKSIAAVVAAGVMRAFAEQQGDILAFLPGAGEIQAAANILSNSLDDCALIPLYGGLPFTKQQRAFQPDIRGRRRVILASAIAETSVTIEGISSVVDSGWSRLPVFDPATGLDGLQTVRVSKAAMAQRKGRAGRLGPGACYRLWTKAMEYSFPAHHPPEIRQTDLSSFVLEAALWGARHPNELQLLDPPTEGAWQSARELLFLLDALDENGAITDTGKTLAAMPVHPRLGAMILKGKEKGSGSLACDIAALVSERDIFIGKKRTSDLEERLQVINKARRGSKNPSPPLKRVLQQSSALARQCRIRPGHTDTSQAGQLVAFAYPDRIAQRRKKSRNFYLLANGKGAFLPIDDPLCGYAYIVAPSVQRKKEDAKIFLAAHLDKQDLAAVGKPSMSKEISWDAKTRSVTAHKKSMLGKLVLECTPLEHPDPQQVTDTLLEGIANLGLTCLDWTAKDATLQNRIALLRQHNGHNESSWPDIRTETLTADLSWLRPYLSGFTKLQQAASLDLSTIFLSMLSYEQQQALDTLAPSHLKVPSGSRKRLAYHEDGTVTLPVRIQEMFGCNDTLTICNGCVPIIVHLLSPAGRPLQITSDLKTFWQTTYTYVKKDMAGRYPKHYWPDDPANAQATSRTKKTMHIT